MPPQARILEDIQSVRGTENYLTEGLLLKNGGDCFRGVRRQERVRRCCQPVKHCWKNPIGQRRTIRFLRSLYGWWKAPGVGVGRLGRHDGGFCQQFGRGVATRRE